MFRKMPVILIFISILFFLFGSHLPVELKQFFYAISLTIRSLILFLLPLIVFSLLFQSSVVLKGKATVVFLFTLVLIVLSNFFSTFLSRYVGLFVYDFDLSILAPKKSVELLPLWSFYIPKWIQNDEAMLLGAFFGIISSRFFQKFSEKLFSCFQFISSKLLQFILCLIPFFLTGFIVKLEFDGMLGCIVHDYSKILLVIILAQFLYLFFAYFYFSGFRFPLLMQFLSNLFPAAVSGLSTMSSAASMPLTIMGAEKNAKNKDLVRFVIPATVNIHLVGDCIAIPILAYAVLKSYGVEAPTFLNYLVFNFYFVLAKFSVAAVPGGGILVMLPILEKYLGFHSDMLSLITALYLLFDPIITCVNILGNGAFSQGLDQLFKHRWSNFSSNKKNRGFLD